ncbi:MAG: Na+/proline symporter/signal transduction histidine kinase [Gammaproteobacteria bacterium]|jgi:Na+/proline symporter/signal transduction histidine kinase
MAALYTGCVLGPAPQKRQTRVAVRMTLELHTLVLIGSVYFLFLYGIAYITEKGLIPAAVINHPITYVSSLGVFASAWAVYGVVGLAQQSGYGFLTYYLGTAFVFVFAPVVLLPMLRINRIYMLSSLADLLSFRYHSQLAGALVTLFMIIAIFPLLALQIQAVSDSLHILTSLASTDAFSENTRHDGLAVIFCIGIGLLTLSFGSRHLTAHQQHKGLVAAIAFESIVKVVCMLALGLTAIFVVFDGFAGLELWLTDEPQVLTMLSQPAQMSSSRSYLLIFFSAAVAMPHLFHMTFAENPSIKAMHTASWGMPLFLLLMSAPVLPILWAGLKLETEIPVDYFALAVGVELDSKFLTILTFVGGLSAASGVIIVTTLALASMCLKHLILPIYRPSAQRDIYRWMRWIRRLFIIFIILVSYLFFRLLNHSESLSDLGLTAFIGTLQFFPGVLAALYWQRANRLGFICGLIAGFSVWFSGLFLPLISGISIALIPEVYFADNYNDQWSAITIISLGINIFVFGIISLLTPSGVDESAAAQMCSPDGLNRPTRRILSVKNPEQMKEQLSSTLGVRIAHREVDRVLDELNMSNGESRPFPLRRIRNRLETNLSGLMGPSVANQMVNQLLPYESAADPNSGEDISLIEVQLEHHKTHLTGLAAELDNLRLYHRQTLQNLPVGVCSLGQDGEILMWNHSIAKLTAIATTDVTGSYLHALPYPWGKLLGDFINSPEPHLYKQRVEFDGSYRWLNLHKTIISKSIDDANDDKNVAIDNKSNNERVIVLEDATDLQLLENELLHSERLASIGRLAAGVAHEIGNPVTGIACLAQNLRYDTDNPESLATGKEILVQTERVSRIVQTLVNFAHSGSDNAGYRQESVHLKPCIDEAIHLLRLNTEAREIFFENRSDDGCHALGDTQRLLQVFVNLLTNARDASPAGGKVIIECVTISPHVFIYVTDSGSGISEKNQDQIFDPFFTTKEPGEGTGLGLSLAYSIINDLGGNISLESPVHKNRGTKFTIKLNSD